MDMSDDDDDDDDTDSNDDDAPRVLKRWQTMVRPLSATHNH